MTVTFFALVFVLFLLYLILPFLGDAFIGHVELMSPKDKNIIPIELKHCTASLQQDCFVRNKERKNKKALLL